MTGDNPFLHPKSRLKHRGGSAKVCTVNSNPSDKNPPSLLSARLSPSPPSICPSSSDKVCHGRESHHQKRRRWRRSMFPHTVPDQFENFTKTFPISDSCHFSNQQNLTTPSPVQATLEPFLLPLGLGDKPPPPWVAPTTKHLHIPCPSPLLHPRCSSVLVVQREFGNRFSSSFFVLLPPSSPTRSTVSLSTTHSLFSLFFLTRRRVEYTLSFYLSLPPTGWAASVHFFLSANGFC